MQKYALEVGVDCGLSSNVTHNWITDKWTNNVYTMGYLNDWTSE